MFWDNDAAASPSLRMSWCDEKSVPRSADDADVPTLDAAPVLAVDSDPMLRYGLSLYEVYIGFVEKWEKAHIVVL